MNNLLPLLGLCTAALLAVAGCTSNLERASSEADAAAEPKPSLPALFDDITKPSGIAFTYRNGEDTAEHLSILESLGGGVGLIDFDGDGLLDLYFPGGGEFAGLEKKDIVGLPGKLYRNLGGCKFQDVTESAGLSRLAGGKPWFYSHGVAVADYDRDGWPDLLVTGYGRVALFRNVAGIGKERKFEDVTAAVGLTGVRWATSAAFADLDGDGFPDLYVCQYVDWSWEKNPPCTYNGKMSDVCPPRQFSGLRHLLYRNTGKGGFVDVSERVGLLSGSADRSKGLGVVIADLDGDGKPDIYVANDTVDNFLYRNQSKPGTLQFEERGLMSGSARDDRGTPNGSMGTDVGDPERTGKPWLWVTNYENEMHALYQNESKPGRPFFQFHSQASGIAAIGQKYVGWGTAFLDADLDGWQDLFVANGHAIRFPNGNANNRKQKPVLLLNREGHFQEETNRIGTYAATPHLARGVGFGDLDNDGRTDIVISHMNEPASVLRGIGGVGRHWIGFQLAGKDHGCVVGAKAVWEAGTVRQTRFLAGGGSYASSGDRRLLFGLGEEANGRLIVTWPDGTEERHDGLAVDRYYRVTQGQPKPVPERAPGK